MLIFRNVTTTIGYIALNFYTEIPGSWRRNLYDFGDPLTFLLAPPSGPILCFIACKACDSPISCTFYVAPSTTVPECSLSMTVDSESCYVAGYLPLILNPAHHVETFFLRRYCVHVEGFCFFFFFLAPVILFFSRKSQEKETGNTVKGLTAESNP